MLRKMQQNAACSPAAVPDAYNSQKKRNSFSPVQASKIYEVLKKPQNMSARKV